MSMLLSRHTRRRQFVAGFAISSAAWAWCRPGQAQAPGARKIGYLHPSTAQPDSSTLMALRAVWERLGYSEPDTVVLRSARGDAQLLPKLALEIVELGAGVLIAVGPAAVRAANDIGRAPVVAIDLETDPIRSGLAASFSRPGGNVTGLFLDQPSLAGKWIELLLEAAPEIERVALLWEPGTPRDQLEAAIAATREKGIASLTVEVRTPSDHRTAILNIGDGPRTGAVRLGAPGFLGATARALAEAAEKRAVPTLSFLKQYAKAGLLMTYGPDQGAYFGRAPVLADRVLKGETPGDLPLEQPTKFELVINLKTSKALGLTIPPTLLARADEVIE